MYSRILPAAGLTMLVSSQAFANPPVQPNSNRYHERNPSAATGRAGNATLEARALLAKDGSTLLEVTTGRLDSSAAAPGNLDKVQLKTFNGDGEVVMSKNFTGLTAGGYFTTTLDGLQRGQSLQSQANIKGIDGKRTNVVTVQGNARLRPDLAVQSLDAPGRATVGAVVNIVAVVNELNQDTGATGDCVLAADGTEIDRAPGIWVDSGGTVSCAFTHAFDSTGTKRLTVSVTGVTPGDWDTANNSTSRDIEIVSNTAPFYWSAWAQHYDYVNSGRSEGWSRWNDGYYANASDWNYTWNHVGFDQYAGLWGYTNEELTWPIASFEASHATGDQSFRGSGEELSPDWSYEDPYYQYGYSYVQRWDAASNSWFYVQTYHSGNYAQSYAQTYRYAGAAVYLSRGYSRYWYSYGGTEYSGVYYYQDSSYTNGLRLEYGPTYSVGLSVTDANGTVLQAQSTIDLQPSRYDYDQAFACYDYGWSYGYQHYCQEYHYHQTGLYGSSYGVN